jgi:hypothetical protein
VFKCVSHRNEQVTAGVNKVNLEYVVTVISWLGASRFVTERISTGKYLTKEMLL